MLPIYPHLQDHPSVLKHPVVRGVGHNLFFVDHTQQEDARAGEGRSKSNKHEAQFVSRLVKYMLQQGYSPDQITVLVTCCVVVGWIFSSW